MFDNTKKYLQLKWEAVKGWFLRSETILVARTAVFGGFVYAGLAGVDWSHITSLDFTDGISRGEMLEAAKWIGMGLIVEYARRLHDPDLVAENTKKNTEAVSEIKAQ